MVVCSVASGEAQLNLTRVHTTRRLRRWTLERVSIVLCTKSLMLAFNGHLLYTLRDFEWLVHITVINALHAIMWRSICSYSREAGALVVAFSLGFLLSEVVVAFLISTITAISRNLMIELSFTFSEFIRFLELGLILNVKLEGLLFLATSHRLLGLFPPQTLHLRFLRRFGIFEGKPFLLLLDFLTFLWHQMLLLANAPLFLTRLRRCLSCSDFHVDGWIPFLWGYLRGVGLIRVNGDVLSWVCLGLFVLGTKPEWIILLLRLPQVVLWGLLSDS
jgi:hypothetical protein